jgi:hypothetical protein
MGYIIQNIGVTPVEIDGKALDVGECRIVSEITADTINKWRVGKMITVTPDRPKSPMAHC